MSEGFEKTFATEERPCGDCFWFRVAPVDIPFCKKKLMGVTSTMRVTYRITSGTCFEAKTVPSPTLTQRAPDVCSACKGTGIDPNDNDLYCEPCGGMGRSNAGNANR